VTIKQSRRSQSCRYEKFKRNDSFRMLVTLHGDGGRVCPAIDCATTATDSSTATYDRADHAASATSNAATSFYATGYTTASFWPATTGWSPSTSGWNHASARWSYATSGSHATSGGSLAAIRRNHIVASRE
jgi:hypothetical protein